MGNTQKPSRRKRRIVFALAATGLVLLLTPVVFESWRQYDIKRAWDEHLRECEYVAGLFPEDTNFGAWYRARLRGSDGTAEFRALLATSTGASDECSALYSHLPAMTTVLREGEAPGAVPSPELVDSFIAASEQAESRLAAMRAYDCLIGVPDVTTSHVEVLPLLNWWNIMSLRPLALGWRGRWEEAAESAVIAMELASRMRQPATIMEELQAHVVVQCARGTILQIGHRMPFTPDQLDRLRVAAAEQSTDRRGVIEGEFAHLALTLRRDGSQLLDDDAAGWFYWLIGGQDPESAWSRAFEPAAKARGCTLQMRSWRPFADAIRSGAPLPATSDYEECLLVAMPHRIPTQNVEAEMVRALVAVRAAENAGARWGEIALSQADYPRVALTREGDQIILAWRHDESAPALLGDFSWQDWVEARPPLRLRPMRLE